MKNIETFIKAHRLDEVTGLLHSTYGLTGVSVHEIKGFRRGRGNAILNPTKGLDYCSPELNLG